MKEGFQMGFEIFGLDFLYVILLFGAGSFAGFLNTVAFGGSLITLPTLIFLLNLPWTIYHNTRCNPCDESRKRNK